MSGYHVNVYDSGNDDGIYFPVFKKGTTRCGTDILLAGMWLYFIQVMFITVPAVSSISWLMFYASLIMSAVRWVLFIIDMGNTSKKHRKPANNEIRVNKKLFSNSGKSFFLQDKLLYLLLTTILHKAE